MRKFNEYVKESNLKSYHNARADAAHRFHKDLRKKYRYLTDEEYDTIYGLQDAALAQRGVVNFEDELASIFQGDTPI